jgi:choline dehydrogenase-like flavoprotein
LRNGAAQAVEFRHHGVSKVARAHRDVILSAGTIASPKILMLSGIGPGDELQRHDIDCAIDLPGVGRELQEHPGIMLSYDVTMRTMNVDMHSRLRLMLRALQFALLRNGPGTTPISHVGVFFRTRPGLPEFDAQIHFQPLGYEVKEDKVILAEANRVSLAVNVCRPKSRGRILLRSPNPQDAPVIDHPLVGNDGNYVHSERRCRRSLSHIGHCGATGGLEGAGNRGGREAGERKGRRRRAEDTTGLTFRSQEGRPAGCIGGRGHPEEDTTTEAFHGGDPADGDGDGRQDPR